MKKKAVFLDRDGTVNREVHYLSHPDQLELLEGAAASIALLNQAGFLVVVITNQAGVAKGFIRDDALPLIRDAFMGLLENQGACIDGYYQCPHHPEGTVKEYTRTCDCRKPAPGLLFQASRDLDIDLSRSYVVGDKLSDVMLAQHVGATGIMVLTGHGRNELGSYPETVPPPDYTGRDIYDAVQWILNHNPA